MGVFWVFKMFLFVCLGGGGLVFLLLFGWLFYVSQ